MQDEGHRCHAGPYAGWQVQGTARMFSVMRRAAPFAGRQFTLRRLAAADVEGLQGRQICGYVRRQVRARPEQKPCR
jgi:hypothetical protein